MSTIGNAFPLCFAITGDNETGTHKVVMCIPCNLGIKQQNLILACTQPMKDVVTKKRRLSLAGRQPRISPVSGSFPTVGSVRIEFIHLLDHITLFYIASPGNYFSLNISTTWKDTRGDVHYFMYATISRENLSYTWWRHQMEAFSALLAFCEGNPPVTGELSTQRPATRSFDVLFDLRLRYLMY